MSRSSSQVCPPPPPPLSDRVSESAVANRVCALDIQKPTPRAPMPPPPTTTSSQDPGGVVASKSWEKGQNAVERLCFMVGALMFCPMSPVFKTFFKSKNPTELTEILADGCHPERYRKPATDADGNTPSLCLCMPPSRRSRSRFDWTAEESEKKQCHPSESEAMKIKH